ncbi:MAG: CsbD family protein [Candidatus Entotheonellia bacterium]
MNSDIFEGRWRQMRGDLRSWWGRLSDNDFEKIAGKKDRLIGMLQEKYGYTREAAQQEVDRRFKEYDERMRAASPSGNPSKPGETVRSASQSVGVGQEGNAEEMASSAATMASQPISAVGEKIGSLAGVIREKAPHEGTVGTAATAVAEKLDAAGSYLQEKNLDHMMGDLSDMIRRYPVPSLLVGLGIGYLLARSTRR